MEHRILVGTGDDKFDESIKNSLEQNGVGQVVSTVLMRDQIVSRAMDYSATMVIVDDDLVGMKGTDDEWTDIVEDLRRIDMDIRFVFICNRPVDDLLLTKLAFLSVTDIFHEGKLPAGWIEQLKEAPRFEHAEKFRTTAVPIEQLKKTKKIELPAEELAQKTLTPEFDQVKTRTVERIVEKKVVEAVSVPRRTVAFVSLYPTAGSSTLVRLIADYLAQYKVNVGVMESAVAEPAWFEILQAWKLGIEEWKSWHTVIHSGDMKVSWSGAIEIEGVKYIVKGAQDKLDGWKDVDSARLFAFSKSMDMLLCDLSTSFNDEREQIILNGADAIVAVGGYDTVRLLREDSLERIKLLGRFSEKLFYVLSKSTKRLKRQYAAELKSRLGVKKLYELPALVEMMELYIEGESFWNAKNVRDPDKKAVQDTVEELLNAVVDPDFVRKLRSLRKPSLAERLVQFLNSGDDVDLDETTA